MPAPEVRLRRGLAAAIDFQELVACGAKAFKWASLGTGPHTVAVYNFHRATIKWGLGFLVFKIYGALCLRAKRVEVLAFLGFRVRLLGFRI